MLDRAKTLWLSPEKILYCSLSAFDSLNFRGAIIGGEWDRLEKRFEDLDIYVALRQALREGKDWTDTAFYQRTLEAINRGEFPWGCADENDLQERCRKFEKLFQTIKNEGYKSQRELLTSERLADPLRSEDEITISIGRHGDMLFSNGAPRLAIARLLDLKQIPVKVAVRHPGWMLLRERLFQYAKTRGGILYQPATHPDLADVPASHECEDRFLMIKENMVARKGRLLDIGANLGYFCHRFENEGFECYALEDSPTELFFLQRLRRGENRRFKIVGKSIFDWSQVGQIHFDVALALNIFHHAIKTKDSYHKLISLLQKLRMGELFFETATEDDPQMTDAYRNYSPSEFVEFIMQNSVLHKAEVIGKAAGGREIYRLS
jgi:2-polyprenyl-3-methyl-5-hydroxy-6-metoxy-1,4-benzoquinol methylase